MKKTQLEKTLERNKKEYDSWPAWKKAEAEQWYARLKRAQEAMREYNETLGQQ